MITPKTQPQEPFEFALGQLTQDVKPLVLKTMHGLISSVLTSSLVDPSSNEAESRAMAKFLRKIEEHLGGVAFSSVSPQSVIRYVTPSQLPGEQKKTPRQPKPKKP